MDKHENCHVEAFEKPVDKSALSAASAAILAVYGMGCPRCAMRVRNGLLSLDGVLVVDVLLERNIAAVAYNPQKVAVTALETAVTNAGNDGRHSYQAQLISTMPANEAFTITT